jgi:hypothetical protein
MRNFTSQTYLIVQQFKKDPSGTTVAQGALHSLLKGLPFSGQPSASSGGTGTSLAELAEAEAARLKAALDLQDANETLRENLEAANYEITKMKEQLQSNEKWVPSFLTDGIFSRAQENELPRCIKTWAIKNSQKWAECRVSWAWTGNRDIADESPSNFMCSLDQLDENDKQVCQVTFYKKQNCFCGLRLTYNSKKAVEHGDCSDSNKSDTFSAGNSLCAFVGVEISGPEGRPNSIALTSNIIRYSSISCDGARTRVGYHGLAPGKYALKGFWSQHDDIGFQRLGAIWGLHLDPPNQPERLSWTKP